MAKAKQPKVPYGVSPSHEFWVPLPGGGYFVFESAEANPNGTSYVRVVDARGGEVAFWISDEWAEEPEHVMGAICGAMSAVRSGRVFYQIAADVEFPPGVEYEKYGDQKG